MSAKAKTTETARYIAEHHYLRKIRELPFSKCLTPKEDAEVKRLEQRYTATAPLRVGVKKYNTLIWCPSK